jgi:hypothetical protein
MSAAGLQTHAICDPSAFAGLLALRAVVEFRDEPLAVDRTNLSASA